METSQRYIVREITGYSNIGAMTQTTDVYVIDRHDCHRVVRAFTGQNRTNGQRRLEAAALARKLEQDHRSWLSGRVA